MKNGVALYYIIGVTQSKPSKYGPEQRAKRVS